MSWYSSEGANKLKVFLKKYRPPWLAPVAVAHEEYFRGQKLSWAETFACQKKNAKYLTKTFTHSK